MSTVLPELVSKVVLTTILKALNLDGRLVNPRVYGDKKTRLYVYWTVDGSKATGCFDLTCPGFVQTSKEIALGAAICPISVANCLPYEITIYIFKDPNTSNWWMQYGEKINVGYWPHNLFSLIISGAESVEWEGGEVSDNPLGQSPLQAEMGNGEYPNPIFGDSGYMKRMRVLDNSRILKFPEWVSTYADKSHQAKLEIPSDGKRYQRSPIKGLTPSS
ncbi:hypothetical protein Pint_20382 [Pistacia integerrima]|uniref:Uncharacterized protein n=1 Tax=Pistacia integerrima TaxID=434235 RepID=A0ACC0X8A3_9ROSI|nr:hypothetical protein Pint_20382 [Pistacia integerrima]